jgi:phage gpG-like protein
MQTQLDLSELSRLNSTIENLKLKPEQIPQAAAGIRLIIQSDVDQRFDSSPGVSTGGTVWGDEYWAAVQPQYLEYHPRRVGGQLLRDTGELQQSFTAEGTSAYAVSGDEIVFGSALPKAGGLNRKRPIVFWHPYLVEQVAEYLANWLAN